MKLNAVFPLYIHMCVFVCRHTYMATEGFQGLNYCCLGFFLLKCDVVRWCDIEEQQWETEALENVDERVTEWARFTSLPWPQWFPRQVCKWSFGRLLYSCHWLRVKWLKMQNGLRYYSKPFKWYSTNHSMLEGEGECALYYCNFLRESA